ncbi:MAG TPA: RIP metalloprotease RseP [Sphingomicrobium sp.]|nr:RIP metalloprotease RseP [Sphingomicrobium sp.]
MLAQPPAWFMIVAFLCAIGPLIIIHELGHYWVARWFGIGAETFSIGFGRKIAGWTDKRGTLWKVGWLPLGGFVRFVGDEDAASSAADQTRLSASDQKRSFHLRPVYQRFLVVLAGPLANFAFAILIFAVFFMTIGAPRTANVVDRLEPGGAAQAAGIQPGDRILAIAGRKTETFEQVSHIVTLHPDEAVGATIVRGGQTIQLPVRIGVRYEKDRFGQKYRIGRLGIWSGTLNYDRLDVIQALPAATSYTISLTRSMMEGIWQIVSGRRSVKELGGPLKIAQVAGQQASLGALQFIQLVALISINLGFINLLPVPMLDGGHLLFYSIEAVRRRPVSAAAQDWAFRGGLALLVALLLVTTFNDLGSFGLWDRLERLIG